MCERKRTRALVGGRWDYSADECAKLFLLEVLLLLIKIILRNSHNFYITVVVTLCSKVFPFPTYSPLF